MIVKLLTEHHLEILSFKGGCTGSSESTLVKMPHCWKSHAMAQIVIVPYLYHIMYMFVDGVGIWRSHSRHPLRKHNWLRRCGRLKQIEYVYSGVPL